MLIMDMPSNCYECELNNYHFCDVTGDNIEIYRNTEYKPTWCPLREVPQKKEVKSLDEALEELKNGKDVANIVFEPLTNYGYNACIDEILGGGE